MSAWIAIVAVGLASYGLRVGPLLLRTRCAPSAAMDDVIRLAGTAAVTGLLVTSCLRVVERGSVLPVAAALAVGAVLAWQSKPMYAIVAAGLGTQWVLLLLLSA